MAVYQFSHNGYNVYLAAFHPSKRARGGHTRSLQIRNGNIIKKQIRYDTNDIYAHGVASKKCIEWINVNPIK